MQVEDYFDQFSYLEFLQIQKLPSYRQLIVLREQLSRLVSETLANGGNCADPRIISLNDKVIKCGEIMKDEVDIILSFMPDTIDCPIMGNGVKLTTFLSGNIRKREKYALD